MSLDGDKSPRRGRHHYSTLVRMVRVAGRTKLGQYRHADQNHTKGGRAMFNLDERQWRIIRYTAASAFAFWLFSQIADSSFLERLWSQLAILTVAAGAIRVLMLGAKTRSSR
jgi:hypothetical protein